MNASPTDDNKKVVLPEETVRALSALREVLMEAYEELVQKGVIKKEKPKP